MSNIVAADPMRAWGWPVRLAVILAAGAFSAAAVGQTLPALRPSPVASWAVNGPAAGAAFGSVVITAGDINGDGFSDALVGAPQFSGSALEGGKLFLFLGGPTGLSATPAWNLEGRSAGGHLGAAVAFAGDLNGDGFADVVVGEPGYSGLESGEGRALVFFGTATGLSGTPAWTMEGGQAGAGLGTAVASAGDVNGDGFADLALGAPGFSASFAGEGRALVLLGSATGLRSDWSWSVDGGQPGAAFGTAIDAAGDVNGDGFGDLIVGAPGYQGSFTGEGAARLFLGSATGLSATPNWTITGGTQGAACGKRVAGAGDLNGDGYADVLVGAPNFSGSYVDQGQVRAFSGSPTGLDSEASWILNGDQAGALCGAALVGAGDINGDGFADFALGMPGLGAGRVLVFSGGPVGPGNAPLWIENGETAGEQFGAAIGAAGDTDGDGFGELLVGAPRWSTGGTGEGKAFLYRSGGDPPAASPTWYADGPLAYGKAGWVVANAGDVNGDGFSDVLFSAPGDERNPTDPGRVWLYLGSATGLAASPAWSTVGTQPGMQYGFSINSAGDVNGDGYDDVLVGERLYQTASTPDAGKAYLFLGGAMGLAPTPAWTMEGAAGGLGCSVASAGDVNGDGYSDVVVGNYKWSDPLVEEGTAWLFLGGPLGLSTVPAWSYRPEVEWAHFGWSAAPAGDVNGDGYGDVIFGAPRFNKNDLVDEGRAYVFLGGPTGLSPAPIWTFDSDQGNARFGYTVAGAGDVNGDGFSDIVVGAHFYTSDKTNQGAAYVFYGSPSGPSTTPSWVAYGDQAGADFGFSVSSAGDVNRDGYDDLLVGAELATSSGGQSGEGQAFVFLGSATGLGASPAWSFSAGQRNAQLGYSVARAGDVNGDGFGDLLVGARQFNKSALPWEEQTGRVFLFAGGGGNGPARRPQQIKLGASAPIAFQGRSDSGSGFRLAAFGRTPAGRGRVSLEWDVKPFGTPFDGLNLQRTAVQDTGEPGSTGSVATGLTASIGGLAGQSRYRWRMRIASNHPLFPHSPWLEPPEKPRGLFALRTLPAGCNPIPDICDGLDNDCDGLLDEDYASETTSCGVGACGATGVTSCVGGKVVDSCAPGTASAEVCDGIDNDCDGTVDEDFVSAPTDCGVGACGSTGVTSCVGGKVVDSCSPGTASLEVCDGIDNDCDGTVDEDYAPQATSCGVGACGATGVTSCVAGKVVDSCAPGTASLEVCDGIDNDCDGTVDEDYAPHATSCGIGACGATGVTSCVSGKVVDSCAPGTPSLEVCDGIDNDCDGTVDEDYAPQATSCGIGACGATGVTSCVSGKVVDSCAPGTASLEVCDGIDNDCDGTVDEDFVPTTTSCGLGACGATGVTSCVGGKVVDSCTPGTASLEVCDGVDNDCDGTVDEDYAPQATNCGIGACGSTGVTSCVGGKVVDSCAPGTASTEVCDGIDNDCDGTVDEDFVPTTTSCGLGACGATGVTSCVGGKVVDSCTPGTASLEVCDGIDNDCDGTVDEDFVPTTTSCGIGACGATGVTSCVGGKVVDSCAPGTPSLEVCDGVDNDCDGTVDEDYAPHATSCGLGACGSTGVTSCVGGKVVDSCAPGTASLEVCDGIDNDCDGTVDEDYAPQATSCGIGACGATGVTSCVSGKVVDSCAPGTPALEVCDGVDNDCDGTVDEDYAPHATSCGVGACGATGVTSCVSGKVVDSCAPGTASLEVCDGIDNDCDGTVDEDFAPHATSCGIGACGSTGVTSCVSGKVVDSCAPGTASAEVCDGIDNDCDGTVDEDYAPHATSCGVGACGATGVTSCVGGKVVDSCAPGTPSLEVCDGIDNDCDGTVDEDFAPQATSCGVGACGATGVTSCVSGKVVDSCAPGTPSLEVCDGIDNDCDGTVDEDFAPHATSCGVGACGATGVTSCVGGKVVDSCAPGTPSLEVCDGVDNDCDGTVDEDYAPHATSCGLGACGATGVTSCVSGKVVDSCTPGTPSLEVCDGIDNDCDGTVDEDYAPTATSCGLGACRATGVTSCVSGKVVDSCAPGTPSLEVCDGIDNDCDGTVDEDFAPQATSCGVGACGATGVTSCVSGKVVDSCTPGTASLEVCDGIDNDCDGTVDEDYAPTVTSCGVGACGATGVTSCVGGKVVDSCAPGTASLEVCDGIDNDCDGSLDEDYAPTATSCGVGACSATGVTSCVGGKVLDSCAPGTPSLEVCDGIDNDCDGSIDEDFVPTTTHCGLGACGATGVTSCVGGKVVDSCAPGTASLEVCDGVDNDCDGTVDEVPPPTGRPVLNLKKESGGVLLSWMAVPAATGFSLVRGGLTTLKGSGGDFASATQTCLSENLAATSWSDGGVLPAAGDGYWFLVRAINCGGRGTYDEAGEGEIRSRDPGIQNSPAHCP